MKILLAEDDPNISMIAKMTLESIGNHDVTHVNNGEDALNEALTEKYELILLDEMMPRMNGLKVCSEYKEKSDNPSPIIFLSAKSQSEDVSLFEESGLGFIAKPFDPALLCQQIENLLGTGG